MRLLLLCLFVFFSLTGSFSQSNKQKTPNCLLWRISGNGLQQPSYLYGTLHLSDERLFNFNDSLLLAIEKSEGLATEIEPTEIIAIMMEDAFDIFKKSKTLKDAVGKDAFARYAPLLSKSLQKPEEEITLKDIFLERYKWMKDAYKKGTMAAILDVWLYDLARRQGKWVGGIEDMEDQQGLAEGIFIEQDLAFLTADSGTYVQQEIPAMIEAYEKQDIDSLEAFGSIGGASRKELLLLRRNVKMANRIDSLSAVRTMVFAVGASHLAGDSGLISLLRHKGFDIQPVLSSGKIVGKNYHVVSNPVVWQKFEDTEDLYEIEMPGNASLVKISGLMQMRIYVDLLASEGYIATAFTTYHDMRNPEKVLQAIAKDFLQSKKVLQGNLIYQDGIKGREYFGIDSAIFKRARVFSSGQTIYAALAYFKCKDSLLGQNATHFIESLKLKTTKSNPDDWFLFENQLPGLKIGAPFEFDYNKQMSEGIQMDGFETKAFTGIDEKTGDLYIIMSQCTIEDRYIPSDSLYLDLFRIARRKTVENIEKDTMTMVHGIYKLEQKGSMDDGVRFHTACFVQGNRSYSLTVLAREWKGRQEMIDKVINSFEVTVPQACKWATQISGDNNFSTWAPDKFKRSLKAAKKENFDGAVALNARDTSTSYVFSVFRSALDTNLWYKGQSEYWGKKLAEYNTNTDTVISAKPFKGNGLEGYDLIVGRKTPDLKIKMIRLFIYGNTAYKLFACLPVTEKEGANVRRFFTDFRFLNQAQPTTILSKE